MGKIDINEIKKDSSELIKSDELKETNDVKAPSESSELIDNASEKSENASETAEEQKQEEPADNQNKVVVLYVGGGVWKDSCGKLWANTNRTDNILCERHYSREEYETRDDIKFMVEYGEMRAIHVGNDK